MNERREPDFEDEKIRYWKARSEGVPPEQDPTILDIDLAREEIFESRVYGVTNEALRSVAMELLANFPDLPPEVVLIGLLDGLRGSSFRIMAKRDRSDGLITWNHASTIGDSNELIERIDRRPEEEFRAFVEVFEADVMTAGVVYEPTVVTVEEWRQHQLGDQYSPS